MKHYRVLIYSILELASPFHLGSGRVDDVFSDQPVLRDGRDRPFIPGGTLAGAFRTSLSSVDKARWMGGDPGDPDSLQASALVIDDAGILPEQSDILRWPVEIRDQVSLERTTLSALTEHHFTMEVLPVGTRFVFSCRCDMDSSDDASAFINAFKRFLARGGRLGGKQNSVQGRWTCSKVGLRTLDLSTTNDLKEWLLSLHGFHWTGNWNGLKKAQPKIEIQDLLPLEDQSIWAVEMAVELDKGLHLSAANSGMPQKESPDLQQAWRRKIDASGKLEAEYVDFGTTVKGRLRTMMEMLLRSYLLQKGKPPDQLCSLIPNDPTKTARWKPAKELFGDQESKGRWWVDEHAWEEAETTKEDHIRIDEFTQNVMRHFKFEFAPMKKGRSKVRVCLPDEAPDWQKVLVLYAAKLAALNIIPWGGHASRGYIGARLSIINEQVVSAGLNMAELNKIL